MLRAYFSCSQKLSNELCRFVFVVVILTITFTVFSDRATAQLNLDTTFNAGVTDADTNLSVTRPLADGKILVGGFFRIVNGAEKSGLARLNADGSLDNTFNAGGSGPNNGVYEIVESANGKFLIGGNFTAYNGIAQSGIVRINADGTLDTTFNPGGVGTIGSVQTIALQLDGKILIAGSGLSAYNGTARFSVIRLNADGTLDTSFNSPFTSAQFVEEVDVQTDGKILIGGSFFIGGRADVARLNPDGSLDASFNPTGVGTDGGVYAMIIQPDGKILIGGGFQSYNGVLRPGVARLNTDGSLDASFNPNIGIGINGGEYFAIQPDGKILVAGGFGDDSVNYSLIRLNADGTLDNTFILSPTNSTGYHVSRQADGKILLSGYFTVFNNQPRRNLVRLNADGTLDNSFNASFSTFGAVNAIALQADGKIVVGGSFNLANGVSRPSIARFNAEGSLDASFNSGTGTSPDPVNASNVINDIAVQSDGKIIIAGIFGGYNGVPRRGIARLNANGSLDTSFISPFAGYLVVFAFDVLAQPDGKILIAGQFVNYAGTGQFLLRLNANGSVDSSFTGNPNSQVRSIARQSDGKLIIGGGFTIYSGQSRNRIARINADGSLDTTFNPGTGFNGTVLDLALQPDGKILAAGTFTTFNGASRNRIARLNTDGSLDTSFNVGGGANNTVWSIALQADGKVIIGGLFSAFSGFNSNRLARLNGDGSFDSSFVSGFDNDPRFFVRRLLTQTDGKILVGGTFKAYNNVSRNSLLRLTASVLRRTQFDFDGDGKADVSVFRPSDGAWYLLQSQNGFTGVTFGISTDRIVPADYDGDGKTDVAVYRDGTWYIQRSQLGFTGIAFGASEDIPVPADYDGDGKADVAVFRPSTGIWYLLRSQLGFTGIAFGQSGDKPVAADYDGDGKADIAVFRNGTWYIQRSQLGFTGVEFGESTDKPVPADYDGDSKADVAVYRPSNGTWYLQRSQLGFTGIAFGLATDLPTPADYDGDGKADVAVFRDGTWYLLRSRDGFTGVSFGVATDKPVPNVFVP